eukprot:9486285-Pyramimonas_sp.AAC.1
MVLATDKSVIDNCVVRASTLGWRSSKLRRKSLYSGRRDPGSLGGSGGSRVSPGLVQRRGFQRCGCVRHVQVFGSVYDSTP